MTAQEIKDIEYTKSLGYSTEVLSDDEFQKKLEYEMCNCFDNKKKTMKYLKSLY